ncbi:putative endoglucanase [Talaromyces proteolyticus]|uniref:xyloglucan-specific endo-beta-1,4-glucanase n=1 Tax=Talaromyces proteolyticus TaxID=1131652 RepID=A0AAD4PY24_9EURO|nr:putative endoglucanase [Talaromyces proteolyticus]KAH8700655.1 putative endoglucanase [Talaromyces proteolyticus]
MKLSYSLLLPILTLGNAVTGSVIARRELCGQYDSKAAGPYTLYTNLWGESSATSGWQCSAVDYQSGNEVSWHTVWDWAGTSNGVKSYSNIELKFNEKQFTSIENIPTTWVWSYTGSNIVADVSYDIFTSDSPNGAAAYEIMIWLGALGGAGPISSTGSPIATVNIAGATWKLYYGINTTWKVFSFVAESEQTSFNADLLDFFKYLIQHQGYPSTQYVGTIAAGTEPFVGSGQLTTTEYLLSVN